MNDERNRIGEMASSVLYSRARRVPIPPLGRKYGCLSLTEAYEVQDVLTKDLCKCLGPVSGYKIAFATNDALRKHGINEPVCGRLFTNQQVPNGGCIPSREFMLFHIESEVAFVMGRSVDRIVYDRFNLQAYVQTVHPAFDIADSCYDVSAGEQSISDFIANDCGASHYVIGNGMPPEDIDIDNLVLELLVNDRKVAEGSTGDLMSSPWNILLWLARHQLRRGFPLRAGDVVLTSKVAPPYKANGPRASGDYLGRFGPLGSVSCMVR